jgi:hypothetical protein
MRLRRSGSGAQRLPLRVGEWLGRATSNISLSASLLRSVMRHDEPGSSKALSRHVLGDCFRCGAMGPLRSSVRATPELMSEPILMMHVARPSPSSDGPARLRLICVYSSSEVRVSDGASGFVRLGDPPQSFTKIPISFRWFATQARSRPHRRIPIGGPAKQPLLWCVRSSRTGAKKTTQQPSSTDDA